MRITTAGHGNSSLQRNRCERIDKRQDRADREIDARRGDDERHGDGDNHQRRNLPQDVEEVRLRQEGVGDERKDDGHDDEKNGDAHDPAAVAYEKPEPGLEFVSPALFRSART